MQELQLVFPTIKHKQAAWEYRQEHIDYGENTINGSGGLMKAQEFESWLEKVISMQTKAPQGKAPGSTYFAFVGDRIVGTIQVRHELNESLLNRGGHIGYGVRPSERRKGYATKMLPLALEKCRELGIGKVLVTCDKINIASAKTILKCGGVLENEFKEENSNIIQRYWITL
jgi:predicted acetyltransferase